MILIKGIHIQLNISIHTYTHIVCVPVHVCIGFGTSQGQLRFLEDSAKMLIKASRLVIALETLGVAQ